MRPSSHGSNNVGLQWERIGVRYYQVVKPLDINNRSAFFSVGSGFPDYKDSKTEGGMFLYIDQAALLLKLVESFIDKGFSFVTK